jgi:hypothetical protein
MSSPFFSVDWGAMGQPGPRDEEPVTCGRPGGEEEALLGGDGFSNGPDGRPVRDS